MILRYAFALYIVYVFTRLYIALYVCTCCLCVKTCEELVVNIHKYCRIIFSKTRFWLACDVLCMLFLALSNLLQRMPYVRMYIWKCMQFRRFDMNMNIILILERKWKKNIKENKMLYSNAFKLYVRIIKINNRRTYYSSPSIQIIPPHICRCLDTIGEITAILSVKNVKRRYGVSSLWYGLQAMGLLLC